MQNVRLALRQFRKSPGFAATVILTIALGIGANTAIFTLVHAILLKSLPVANPASLYRIGDRDDCCVNGGFINPMAISISSLTICIVTFKAPRRSSNNSPPSNPDTTP